MHYNLEGKIMQEMVNAVLKQIKKAMDREKYANEKDICSSWMSHTQAKQNDRKF